MKRKLFQKILCLAICGSMVLGFFSDPLLQVLAVSRETQDAIDEAEGEKEELEKELEEQEQTKGTLEDKKAGQEEELENLKEEYQSIASDLSALEEKKTEKQTEIEKKTAELEAAIEKQETQYELMKKRIQYMYEQPQTSILELIFQNFDIAQLLNRVEQVVQLQEYDREQLENYEKAAEEIEAQKEDLEAAKKELDSLTAEAEEKQAQVSALQKKTSASISSYLDQIAKAEEEIGNTEEALAVKSEALNKLYAQAQAEEAAEQRRQAQEAANRLQEAIANGSIKAEDSGITYGSLNLSQTEMDMLTAMIYCEARGESYQGQLAVGYVIMNRVRSSKFPNSLEGVLRQNKQFEPAGSGRFDIVLTAYWEGIPGVIGQSEWNSCQKAAMECVNGSSNVGESLFFRTHAPVPQLVANLAASNVPYWIIGNHIFYYSWVSYSTGPVEEEETEEETPPEETEEDTGEEASGESEEQTGEEEAPEENGGE